MILFFIDINIYFTAKQMFGIVQIIKVGISKSDFIQTSICLEDLSSDHLEYFMID
jgi:hypothetical protein